MQAGRPDPISFSSDLHYLRIGSCVFVEDDQGDYSELLTGAASEFPFYFEEFTVRGSIMALASRRTVQVEDTYECDLRDCELVGLGDDICLMEECVSREPGNPQKEDDIEGDDSGEDADSESTSESSVDSDKAYETWSEASSRESDVRLRTISSLPGLVGLNPSTPIFLIQPRRPPKTRKRKRNPRITPSLTSQNRTHQIRLCHSRPPL